MQPVPNSSTPAKSAPVKRPASPDDEDLDHASNNDGVSASFQGVENNAGLQEAQDRQQAEAGGDDNDDDEESAPDAKGEAKQLQTSEETDAEKKSETLKTEGLFSRQKKLIRQFS